MQVSGVTGDSPASVSSPMRLLPLLRGVGVAILPSVHRIPVSLGVIATNHDPDISQTSCQGISSRLLGAMVAMLGGRFYRTLGSVENILTANFWVELYCSVFTWVRLPLGMDKDRLSRANLVVPKAVFSY